MSLSTALIVNVVLDATALGALAYVCRTPFRLAVQRSMAIAPTHGSARQREQRAA